jgi:thiol:disulfide interchange protein DsbC
MDALHATPGTRTTAVRPGVIAGLLGLAALIGAGPAWAQANGPGIGVADSARSSAAGPTAASGAMSAVAVPAPQSAAIRAAFARQFPSMPAVDEVRTTPIPGLFELRIGTDILYATAGAEHVLQGDLIEGRTGRSLTQARIHALTAIDFDKLPWADSIAFVRGKGERRFVAFADPNCGPCRRLESEITKLDNVTVHTFVVPILGPDSQRRARDIWCAADRTAAWRGWMVEGRAPPPAPAGCNTAALERNLDLAEKHRVTGTPQIVFASGERIGGAAPAERIERELARR